MLFIPQKGIIRSEHNMGSVGTLTPGTSCTTGGTSSTKGTPAEIFASTSFDAYAIEIMAFNYALAATAAEGMMDILIGSATEEIMIPNLMMGNAGGPNVAGVPSNVGKSWMFPIYIPSGSRIAVQAAGARVNTAFSVGIRLWGGHAIPIWRVGSKVLTYGVGTVPNGVTVAQGASGAEGSWVEITSSTSENHFAILPSYQIAAQTTITQRAYTLDISIGASTAEELIGDSYWFACGTGEQMGGSWPHIPTFIDIPSGTRLAARVSSSGAANTTSQVVLHCVS